MAIFSLSAGQRRQLERQLKTAGDVRVYRRTLALLEYDRGRSVTEIARSLRVSRPSIYRWIEQYDEAGDPKSLLDDERPGRPAAWTEDCSKWLQRFLDRSPAELGYFAVNWTVSLLRDPLQMCLGKKFSDHTIRRALRQLDYVWKRPRYVLKPDPEREKKTANPLQNQAFAAAQRAAGRRRNRFAAFSTVAGKLEPPRCPGSRLDFGMECPSRRVRHAESADGEAAVSGSTASAATRLSSVLGIDSSTLSRSACGFVVG